MSPVSLCCCVSLCLHVSVCLLCSAACKPSVEPIITVEGLRKRGVRNPVENAMQLKEKRCRTQEAKDIRRAQKEAAGGGYTERSASSTPVKIGGGRGGARRPDLVLEKGEVIDFSSLSSSDRTPLTSPSPSPSPDFSAPGTPASHSATPSLLSEADLIPDVMPPQALFHGEPVTPQSHYGVPLGVALLVRVPSFPICSYNSSPPQHDHHRYTHCFNPRHLNARSSMVPVGGIDTEE